MRIKSIVFLLLFFQLHGCQTKSQTKNKAFSYVDSLFNKDSYNVEILDFDFPKEITELIQKLQNNIAENKEWAEQYFSRNIKEGEPIPYHKNFGITEEEYDKIKDLDKRKVEVVVKGRTTVKVVRNGSFISFTPVGEDKLGIASLKIDFKNEVVLFMNDTITNSNEINAPATTVFGIWHGYSWKKEVSNLKEEDDLKLDSLIAKIVEINFGKIPTNNKILVRIKYKDVYKGESRSNIDMASYFY